LFLGLGSVRLYGNSGHTRFAHKLLLLRNFLSLELRGNGIALSQNGGGIAQQTKTAWLGWVMLTYS